MAFGKVTLRCKKKVKLGGSEVYQIKIQLTFIHRTVTAQFFVTPKDSFNGKNSQYA